jgi:hypothetical protein
MRKDKLMKVVMGMAVVAALIGGTSCAGQPVKKAESDPKPEPGGKLKGVTFNIEGLNVESVDFHDRGSYTNQAFQDADFIGGRIVE